MAEYVLLHGGAVLQANLSKLDHAPAPAVAASGGRGGGAGPSAEGQLSWHATGLPVARSFPKFTSMFYRATITPWVGVCVVCMTGS